MKKTLLLATATMASIMTTHAAVVINNGNFENGMPSGTSIAGTWSVNSGISEVTSGPNLISGSRTISVTGGGSLVQDFVTGADTGLTNFQFDMAFRMDAISAAGDASGAERIRFRDDNNATDLMAFRINAGGIYAYNGASWVNVNSTALSSDTTYYFRMIATDAFRSGGSYTVGISTDGINYTTGSTSNAFFNTGSTLDFETVSVGNGNGGGIFVDNFSVTPIPEPSIALLGGLGLLGLLRRRR